MSEFDSTRRLEQWVRERRKCARKRVSVGESRRFWRRKWVLVFSLGERKRQSQRCWMCSSYELYSRVEWTQKANE